MPNRAECLPGKNENASGITILGRRFRFLDNTDQEMGHRIQLAWARFQKIRHVLKAYSPLRHRLRIYRACIAQTVLWSSQSWHITRKRCQRLRGTEQRMMRTLIPCPEWCINEPPHTKFPQWNDHIARELWRERFRRLDEQWLKSWIGWAGG